MPNPLGAATHTKGEVMQRVLHINIVLPCLVAAFLALASTASAGYTVTLTQTATGVVANGSGEVDMSGLRYSSTGSIGQLGIDPALGQIAIGAQASNVDVYYSPTTLAVPSMFGPGTSLTTPTAGSGPEVGILANFAVLALPSGYISDTALSDSATWSNATLASLGVTPGTYVWTWGAGADQEFTLDIEGASPTPIPGTDWHFGTGLVGLFSLRKKTSAKGLFSFQRARACSGVSAFSTPNLAGFHFSEGFPTENRAGNTVDRRNRVIYSSKVESRRQLIRLCRG